VIAIIGLLSTLGRRGAEQRPSALARRQARGRHIRQIQTALELGFTETNQYPTGATYGSAIWQRDVFGPLQRRQQPAELDLAGEHVRLWGGLPGHHCASPTPRAATNTSTTPRARSQYSITFTLEGDTGMLKAGPNCANPNGIQAGTSC